MLIERIRKGTEENLRNKQAAFRKTRGTTTKCVSFMTVTVMSLRCSRVAMLTSGCVTGLTAAVFGHPFNHRFLGW